MIGHGCGSVFLGLMIKLSAEETGAHSDRSGIV